MRSKVKKVKMNYKGSFENLDCTVCNKERECQKHIMECKKILEMRENEKKITDYEKIFGENVKSQIAKHAQLGVPHLEMQVKLDW